MIVGIVEVNDRRYCCGVWADLEALRTDLGDSFNIEQQTEACNWPFHEAPVFAETATAIYWCQGTDKYLDNPGDLDKTWATDAGGFIAYEFTDKFPGFVGCDED